MRAPLALLPLLAGCSVTANADAAPPDCSALTVRLEVRTPDGTWTSIDAAPRADLLLGFQGFKMVYVRVRANQEPPQRTGAVVIHLHGREPFSQSFPELAARPDGAGGVVSDEFPLFFNGDTLAFLANRSCDLTLRLGTGGCGAVANGPVTLIYREGCLQDRDGGITCTDAAL